MPELSIEGFILAQTKELNRTSKKNEFWLKFGTVRFSSFSTLSAQSRSWLNN